MSEPIIRDAFTYGAGDGEPSDAMWLRIAGGIARRRQRRLWWRRVAVAVATLLLVAGGGVAAVPGARAAVVDTFKGWVTVWQGQVGGAEVVVRWAATEPEGVHYITETWTPFGSLEEAARFLEFPPAEGHREGAVRSRIAARRAPFREGIEVRMASVEYLIGRNTYRVFTSGDYRNQGGAWVLKPYEGIDGMMLAPEPPSNPRKVDLGSTEALCYQFPAPNPDTVCQWLMEGRAVAVQGADPDTVIELAKSVLK